MPRNHFHLMRQIKFVGDPVLVKEDGFGVPNWRYENNRLIDTPRLTRILHKGDGAEIGVDGRPVAGTGLSRDYIWEKSNRTRVIPVHIRDAAIILRNSGNEFKDVTDEAHPESVRNDRIVVKKKRAPSGVAG